MKVSVVIPAHNAEFFLKKAVESVYATNFPVLEIVIVEDGSTDATWEMAMEIRNENRDMVQLLRHAGGANRGAGASRNLGIRNATGDLVTFLDADDRYLPNRFDEAITILRHRSAVDGVYEKTAVEVDKGGSDIAEWTTDGLIAVDNTKTNGLLEAVLRSSWHTNAITLRREVFSTAGYFNTRLAIGQDIEYWLRLAMTTNLVEGNQNEPVALYRRHENNRAFPKNSKIVVVVLSYAILFARKNKISNRNIEILEDELERLSRRRLGWLIENQKLEEAWLCCYWLARVQPSILLRKNFLGNVRNLLLAKIRRVRDTA